MRGCGKYSTTPLSNKTAGITASDGGHPEGWVMLTHVGQQLQAALRLGQGGFGKVLAEAPRPLDLHGAPRISSSSWKVNSGKLRRASPAHLSGAATVHLSMLMRSPWREHAVRKASNVLRTAATFPARTPSSRPMRGGCIPEESAQILRMAIEKRSGPRGSPCCAPSTDGISCPPDSRVLWRA